MKLMHNLKNKPDISVRFSKLVEEYVANGSIASIPNPSRSGYLCAPSDFLSSLIRFLSMMQLLKIGIGREISIIKNDLSMADKSLKITQTENRLYIPMAKGISNVIDICNKEGANAYESGEIELAETYAWCMAGCRLFLDYMRQ